MRIIYLIGAMVVSACCCPPPGSSSRSDEEQPAQTATPGAMPAAAPKAPAEPDVAVDSTRLYADYEANEVAADARYKGKTLAVSGSLLAIDKDFLGNVVLKLKGGKYAFNAVRATLDDSEKASAASLSKGQNVTVVCKGGMRVMDSPTLDECRLQ